MPRIVIPVRRAPAPATASVPVSPESTPVPAPTPEAAAPPVEPAPPAPEAEASPDGEPYSDLTVSATDPVPEPAPVPDPALSSVAAVTETPPVTETEADKPRRKSTKDRVIETIQGLLDKQQALVEMLLVSPDNAAVSAELREASAALQRSLKLLELASDDLGTRKPKVGAGLNPGDVVEIEPKYRDRFAFLKGAENGRFTIESLHGKQVAVTHDDKTIFLTRGMLRAVKP